MKNIFFTVLLFLFPLFLQAKELTVVFSEIGAYEKGGYEWVKIYNSTAESVNLEGWKFVEDFSDSKPEGVKHGLKEFNGGFILPSNSYAAIVQNSDNFFAAHPNFLGLILDSSWSSLKETGEQIALIDSEGITVENFTYLAAPDAPLSRIDFTLADYGASNWFSSSPEGDFSDKEDSYFLAPEIFKKGDIVISEFVSDPPEGEEEWIEIYNTTEFEINLSGWHISEGSEAKTELSGRVLPYNFFILENPKGNLNNSGDIIILKQDNKLIDEVSYGDWEGSFAPNAGDPYSTAKIGDKFLIAKPTKGAENKVAEIIEKEEQVKSEAIIINEILANPVGPDIEREFVELKNISQKQVNLAKWKIKDKSGIEYVFNDVILESGDFLVLSRMESKIALNNTGDEIKLYNGSGKLIDKISFGKSVSEEISYSRGNDFWNWGKSSPGAENIVETPNNLPIAVIYFPPEAKAGEEIIFDASDSYDPDSENLRFLWNLGDGTKTNGPSLRHIYQKNGKYEIILSIIDERGAIFEIKKNIQIGSFKKEKISSFAKVKDDESDFVLPNLADKQKNIQPKSINQNNATLRGVVIAEPFTLGSQIFYVHISEQFNEDSGCREIYAFNKDFPELQIGDIIDVFGEFSETNRKRLKIKNQNDISVVGFTNEVLIPTFNITEIGSETDGCLAQFKGTITEKKSTYFYLDDNEAELKVYVKKQSGISLKNIAAGMEVSVAGIINNCESECLLLPRSQADIKLGEVFGEDEEEVQVIYAGNEKVWQWQGDYNRYVFMIGTIIAIGMHKAWRRKRSR